MNASNIKKIISSTLCAAAFCFTVVYGQEYSVGSYGDLPPNVYFLNHIHSDHNNDFGTLPSFSPTHLKNDVDYYLSTLNAKGLFVTTDHNNDYAFDDLLKNGSAGKAGDRVIAVRSAEWGDRTHLSLIGLKVPHWDMLDRHSDYAKAPQVEAAEGAAEIRIINHPAAPGYKWPWQGWGNAEAVEVWSNNLEFANHTNSKAIGLWQEALVAGRRYTAVGGADFHINVPGKDKWKMLLFPANIVFAGDNTPEKVFEAIRGGRVSLRLRPASPKVFIRAIQSGTVYEMGANAPVSGMVNFEVILDQRDCEREDDYFILIYTSASVRIPALKIPVRHSALSTAAFMIPVQGRDFVRAEVWRMHSERISALSNPVYFNY
ncbi:MAG: hypothetical protein A2270_05060 [Elusimicrobia bacterium RIFOXYA12_FULL_51_18]|nr:MAG: hypothetical protein A2270_05060 [Elusimicrobia bacterium RIFOXYA12_FULL_51_18]OGS28611.1 MAG: hypothetical protein A2218_07335 [Elusimicrobia bacterium RIFOXYA2_FULL_53_38]